jgi:hypothetical protein
MKTMSLSTASDRETSSVGSLSPTMTHIQNQTSSSGACYGSSDQASPTSSIFTYSFSPSDSPILNDLSVASSISPPPIIPSAMFVKPKFIEQTAAAAAAHVDVMKQIPEDARLPVFNQISLSIDSMSTLTI